MHKVKTDFYKLAQQVEAGGEALIARDGSIIMKLSKFEVELSVPRNFSSLKGLISLTSDGEWDRMDQYLLDTIDYCELDR